MQKLITVVVIIYKHLLLTNLTFASCVIKKFKFQGIFFMYHQVKKTFFETNLCICQVITLISAFSVLRNCLQTGKFLIFLLIFKRNFITFC